MNPYELLKCLYLKTKPDLSQIETWTGIQLNKWLSTDLKSSILVKKLLPYLLYVEPKHYYYLLYFTIGKQYKVPFYKIPKTVEIKEDVLIKKIQSVLGWSNSEVEKHSTVLKELLTNKAYWDVELGIER